MPTLVQEKREERNKLIADQRAMVDLAQKEERDFTEDEEQEYQKRDSDLEALMAEIKDLEEKEERSRRRIEKLAELEDVRKKDADKREGPRLARVNTDKELPDKNAEKYRKMFRDYLLNGRESRTYVEFRALQGDSDVKGGYMIAPEDFHADLIQELDNMTFFRRIARVVPIRGSDRATFPVLDADPAAPTWTSEIKTGTEDSSMSFEKRALAPSPLAKRIKVSRNLLRLSAIPVEALVRERLGYQFAITEENAFLNGDGADKPLGVFTASNAGLPSGTGYDVSTGNTTTSIKFDGLMNLIGNMPAQYRNGAQWIFHRDALTQIRKLKDGEGRYIWQASVTTGAPGTILGYSYNESEYAPHTFTTGLYVGIFGNFNQYYIVENWSMEVQRLEELYAETNQVGFIARRQLDGAPILRQAFRRVTLA